MSPSFVIKNARILDVVRGAYHPDGTRLVVRAGVIESVSAASATLPTDIPAIDLGGRFLIPGMINPHVHLQLVHPSILARLSDLHTIRRFGQYQIRKNLADCVSRGITLVADALTENLEHNRALALAITRSEIPGPRIVQCVLVAPSGGPMSQRKGLGMTVAYSTAGINLLDYDDPRCGTVVYSPNSPKSVVRDAVNKAVDERGADLVKLYDQDVFVPSYRPGAPLLSQDELLAAADQARRRSIACTMHHHSTSSMRRALLAGVTSLAHLAYDTIVDDELLAGFVSSDCVLIPTTSLMYFFAIDRPGFDSMGLATTRAIDEVRQQTLSSVSSEFWVREMRESFVDGVNKGCSGKHRIFGTISFAHVFAFFAGMADAGLRNFALLSNSGAKIACGNDAGAIPVTPGMTGLELRLMNEILRVAGKARTLNGADALRACTLRGAESLGMQHKFGSIDPGKTADLVAFHEDPLTQPHVLGTVADKVWIGGKLVWPVQASR